MLFQIHQDVHVEKLRDCLELFFLGVFVVGAVSLALEAFILSFLHCDICSAPTLLETSTVGPWEKMDV